jgi:hypothetical protein
MVRDAGYAILSTFRLPDAAWWDHFYLPLSRRRELLKAQYPDDQEVQALNCPIVVMIFCLVMFSVARSLVAQERDITRLSPDSGPVFRGTIMQGL